MNNLHSQYSEYERKKAEIIQLGLTPEKYENAIKKLAVELGV
jgi:hypothetical protein